MEPDTKKAFDIEMTKQGVQADRNTFETSLKGVFAGGSALRPHRIAARSVADGRAIAYSVHRYLHGNEAAAMSWKFDCRMGALHDGEIDEFLKGVSESPRIRPSRGVLSGFTLDESAKEALRCLHCDCESKNDCMLREYSDKYGAVNKHSTFERVCFERILDHPNIAFEPSKCIKCGSCVRITEAEDESFGLSFSGRSFHLRVKVPFGEPLSKGLEKSAVQCARACPTGALTVKIQTTEHESRSKP